MSSADHHFNCMTESEMFISNLFGTAVRVLINLKCKKAPLCICIEWVHSWGSSPQSLGIGAEATWWITGRWWEEAQPSTGSPSTGSETSSFVISPSGPAARTILEGLFWEHNVGLISTKQWELHVPHVATRLHWSFQVIWHHPTKTISFSLKGAWNC